MSSFIVGGGRRRPRNITFIDALQLFPIVNDILGALRKSDNLGFARGEGDAVLFNRPPTDSRTLPIHIPSGGKEAREPGCIGRGLEWARCGIISQTNRGIEMQIISDSVKLHEQVWIRA